MVDGVGAEESGEGGRDGGVGCRAAGGMLVGREPEGIAGPLLAVEVGRACRRTRCRESFLGLL